MAYPALPPLAHSTPPPSAPSLPLRSPPLLLRPDGRPLRSKRLGSVKRMRFHDEQKTRRVLPLTRTHLDHPEVDHVTAEQERARSSQPSETRSPGAGVAGAPPASLVPSHALFLHHPLTLSSTLQHSVGFHFPAPSPSPFSCYLFNPFPPSKSLFSTYLPSHSSCPHPPPPSSPCKDPSSSSQLPTPLWSEGGDHHKQRSRPELGSKVCLNGTPHPLQDDEVGIRCCFAELSADTGEVDDGKCAAVGHHRKLAGAPCPSENLRTTMSGIGREKMSRPGVGTMPSGGNSRTRLAGLAWLSCISD